MPPSSKSPARRVLDGCVALLWIAACNARGASSEQAYVEEEVVKLRTALAARSESGVAVGCISVTTSLERMPAPLVAEIERICHVEAPRLQLQQAVAAVKAGGATTPELAHLHCMQLYAKDAFATLAQHPTNDEGVRALVAEYTRLCPEQVATFGKPR